MTIENIHMPYQIRVVRPGSLFDLLPDGSEPSTGKALAKVQDAIDYVRQGVAEKMAEVAGGGEKQGEND